MLLRFLEFVSLPLEQKRFCQDCHLLLLPAEWTAHSSHRTLSDDITVARLRRPSLLLRPLENKKSNAQFLFADRSCRFLLDLLAGLGFQKVLCVGTPRYVFSQFASRLWEWVNLIFLSKELCSWAVLLIYVLL